VFEEDQHAAQQTARTGMPPPSATVKCHIDMAKPTACVSSSPPTAPPRPSRPPAQHSCSHCGKEWRNELYWERHMGLRAPRLNRGPACARVQYSCTQCGLVWRKKREWQKHMGRMAPRLGRGPACVTAAERAAATPIQFPCAFCGKVFHLHSQLNTHMGQTGYHRGRGVCVDGMKELEMELEFQSQQAAQQHPAVKEETVNEETVTEDPLTVKCELEEFHFMDWAPDPTLD
jgi:hypothetical protein